jgi:uncharacterized membrane protein YecN with MAPEG domain
VLLTLTASYGAVLTLLVVGLGARVGNMRRTRRPAEATQLASRVHGNAVENIPLFLILFAVCEDGQGSGVVLHALGSLFVASRVAHAIGLSRWPGPSRPRFLGIIGSWTAMVGVAGYAVVLALLGGAG